MLIQTILLLKTARKEITTHQVMWQVIRTVVMTAATIEDLLHLMMSERSKGQSVRRITGNAEKPRSERANQGGRLTTSPQDSGVVNPRLQKLIGKQSISVESLGLRLTSIEVVDGRTT